MHRLSARAKLIAVVVFVVTVVLTPREWVVAFAGYVVVVASALILARVPLRRVATGLTIEIPFVLFAAVLPFVGPEPAGFAGLSVPGLWAAWNILIKASLGVLAATVLAATTLPVELVSALQSMRMPTTVVAILTFFIRYVDVVADQYSRMRVAQQARGLKVSSPRSWPILGVGLGALFVRSFERGERVHLALVSRGYDGRMPEPAAAPAGSWRTAALLPATAIAILIVNGLLRW